MAFLPQFMNPDANTATQALALGAVLFVIAVAVDIAYALGASSIAQRVSTPGANSRQGRLLGTIYLTLAAVAAVTGQRPTTE